MPYCNLIKLALASVIFTVLSIACSDQSSSVKAGDQYFVTDLEKVEQEFNSLYPVGTRVHRSSINAGDNSRINYAYIEIWDSTRFVLEDNRVSAKVLLTAKVSYTEWKTAFGKRYRRDSTIMGLGIALKLETEPQLNPRGDLNAITHTQVDWENQSDFLKHLAGIRIFGKEGKLATTCQEIVLRHSKIQ